MLDSKRQRPCNAWLSSVPGLWYGQPPITEMYTLLGSPTGDFFYLTNSFSPSKPETPSSKPVAQDLQSSSCPSLFLCPPTRQMHGLPGNAYRPMPAHGSTNLSITLQSPSTKSTILPFFLHTSLHLIRIQVHSLFSHDISLLLDLNYLFVSSLGWSIQSNIMLSSVQSLSHVRLFVTP